MYKNGFIDVSIANVNVHLGDCSYNANSVLNVLNSLNINEVSIIAFPELVLTGYSLNDLLYQDELYYDSVDGLKYILDNNKYEGIAIIGGLLRYDNLLFNVAYVVKKDELLGIVPKEKLNNDEKKYFSSGKNIIDVDVEIFDDLVPFGSFIFNADDVLKFGVTIGENASPNKLYKNGAAIVFNICATVSYIGGCKARKVVANAYSIKNNAAYFSCSIGASDSSSEVIYSNELFGYVNGKEVICFDEISFDEVAKTGRIDLLEIDYKKRVKQNSRKDDIPYVDFELEETEYNGKMGVNILPFIPECPNAFKRIIELQAASIYKRMTYIGCKKAILGVSGGLDSTLALLSLVYMCDKYGLDRKTVIGVRLPSSNNSSLTYKNSVKLMKGLGIDDREVKIQKGVEKILAEIGHDTVTKDIAYENAQARYRTSVLMNLGNKEGGLVVGTGDMSEIALGWCTFNGDHMAMYGLNAGLPKTLVRATVNYYKGIYPEVKSCLDSIIATPISPELANNQKTEDLIGKYEINDFILYRYLVCGDEKARIVSLLVSDMELKEDDAIDYVNNFFKRFMSQQFKRLTSPEGVKVLDLSLSPRTGVKLNGDIYFR